VLLEAGLPFAAIQIDEHTKVIEGGGDYRAVNPLGYVPALVLDDGTLLTEGPAIVQYIADQVPYKQLAPPNGTIERTKLQAWLNFFSSEMHKGAFGPLFYKGISEESKVVFRRRLTARFEHLDRHLTEHEYLVGNDFTVADAHFFTVSNWAPPKRTSIGECERSRLMSMRPWLAGHDRPSHDPALVLRIAGGAPISGRGMIGRAATRSRPRRLRQKAVST
jgi:glutathione S-transferase